MQLKPIRDLNLLAKWKCHVKQNYTCKHYAYLVIGLNVGLKVSDLLNWKWDLLEKSDGKIAEHFNVREGRGGKSKTLVLNTACVSALRAVRKKYPDDIYVFQSDCHRVQSKQRPWTIHYAYAFLVRSAKEAGVGQPVGTHTLRKTFGYHVLTQGAWSVGELMLYFGWGREADLMKYLDIKSFDKQRNDFLEI